MASAPDRERLRPFFTTKGLGRAWARALGHTAWLRARRQLRVASEPMRGARFTVSLPRAPQVEDHRVAGLAG